MSILRKLGFSVLLVSWLVTLLPLSVPIVQTSPTAWSIEIVDAATDVGYDTSLALHAGMPAVSYYDSHWKDLKYARWTGTAWSIEPVDTVGDVGYTPSLALDSTGNPHISYLDGTNGDLKYARWTGTTWNIETVESTGAVGEYSSLALDSSGNPHISYYDTTDGDLKYARWTGTAWSIETVDSAGNVGRDSSLALDSSGNPHISYYDDTDLDLKYARWTGTAWNIETVDSIGWTGQHTSLALDSGGNPHISYFDITNGNLRFARWTGSAWALETVDSTGTVGWDTSLVLDSGGNPHISYCDYVNGYLKYAAGVQALPTVTAIESCSLMGERKDSFDMGETVFVNGSGFSPSTGYSFYVVVDQAAWTDGMAIPERVAGTEPFMSSNAQGNIEPVTVWHDPQTAGNYDIIVDVNDNGQYDVGIDVLDDNDVGVTAGFLVSEGPSSDTTPPTISILSPEYKTYATNEVSLTFTVSEPASWIGYCLDGQENQTIAGNTTLFDLADGLHNLVVYAEDASGNIGASEFVQFTVEAGEPEPLPEPFPTWAIVVIGVIAGAAVVVLVYFAKVRKPTGKGK